jgi:para-aminobenzoate synthetase
LKSLLIDNDDSFTYNLFQLLAEVNGEEPIVLRNAAADWGQLQGLGFDNVVISPGPGRPDHPRDFGLCAQVIRRADVPLLGVCLGHEGICWVEGAEVVHAPEVVHGRLSAVLHDGSKLFAGIPREFRAVRYHSLCVREPLPRGLQALARTRDGVLMAVAHRERPLWGVQFHPESICTEHGRRLLANFRDLTGELDAKRGSIGANRRPGGGRVIARVPRDRVPRSAKLELKVKRLVGIYDAEAAFAELFGDSETAFWLDSSVAGEQGRFSFMGDANGPLAAVLTYDVGAGALRIERGAASELINQSIFDYLSGEMARLREPCDELPFEFNCGFVGYLGYELKAECGGAHAHDSPLPDAAFLFADRMLAFDHAERCLYLLCLARPGGAQEAERWIADTSLRVASLPEPGAPRWDCAGSAASIAFHLSRSHEQYVEDIATCKQRLAEGETYEVCLTNTITAAVAIDPLTLYRRLRRVNPAPFSAYLRFGDRAVLSSSPERFLRVDRDRWVEAKPIKGTAPRGETSVRDARLAGRLRSDEKSRAENLMITDLLRNDLGAVCEVGSVHVAHLMRVESYETVHQLVSTVRGRLRHELQPADCLRACFPAGSMTGAPKKRTMEIIDELEGEARGVYAGSIGYLGLGGGCDMSVVIRTIVMREGVATIGVGGAIVMQSDPEEEYQETLLKARAPMAAIDPRVDPEAIFEAAPGALIGA